MTERSSSTFPDELAVDEAVLDELTCQATFAADNAYFQHIHDTGLTAATMTRHEVRAGIRNLLANGLIVAPSLDEIREIIANGVTLS
jgi:hypothetical protein